ncbi:UDP-GlcNAc--UDP-phosphate GlcNAc-1-phosphate transferase [Fontibacter flavus]|uniref:UDP-GlcNAc--UDP-phosphate GlcNAc-1-phosphate transferase n=1 Tax=Fontibacter flavus TaxID=654838 RepID=A0ABV6FVR4_9BACT
MITLALILLPLYFLVFELYLRLAKRWNITDVPNHRSSHSKVTVRGGGIIFVVGAITAFVLGYIGIWPLLGLIISALAGFVDDIQPLPRRLRLMAHFIGLAILLWGGGLLTLPWWILMVIFIAFTGWVNAFNFMDGINGITAFYALVLLGTFYWMSELEAFREFILIMGLSVLVFTFYNARKKAVAFAGDVGSISMAFVIGFLLLELMFFTGDLYYILFVAVYGIDAVITILIRLWQKENIFRPHRRHLYQYMANELQIPHLKVAGIYAISQFLINFSVIFWFHGLELTLLKTMIILLFLALLYVAVRFLVRQKILSNK